VPSINYPNIAGNTVPIIAGFWGGSSPTTGRISVGLSGGSSNSTWGGSSCGKTPNVSYQMSGISPNRVMVIGWNNIDITSIECLSTFQIRIYESSGTDGVVELYYEHMTAKVECANGWGG